MTSKTYKETDENDFAEFLKKRIPSDLMFRGAIVYLIAVLAAVLAVERDRITYVGYFERAGSIAPLVNLVGVPVLLMCVVAMYSKDLEFVSSNAKTISVARGYIAGFFRVLCQYMTLWIYAATVALLGALSAAALSAPLQKEDTVPLSVSFVVLVIFAVAIGAAHTFLRRGGPTPWGRSCSSPTRLTVGYTLAFVVLVWRVMEGSPLPTG